MKKLICAKDMEAFVDSGEKIFFIDDGVILTPSAKDIAKNNEIEITTKKVNNKEIINLDCKKKLDCEENLDYEKVLDIFKAMVKKGVLEEVLKTLTNINVSKFKVQCDGSGLKVVRGNSVKMDVFDTGNKDAKVYFQEIVNKDESKMSAGFLTIEDSKFQWELTYEEIDYVIEGTVTIEINGNTYIANEGDILFVPKDSKVVWGSPNKAKIFYTTYPANWADLL